MTLISEEYQDFS